MKETLHSRHHSTVLPIRGASKKESLHDMHTHAVHSAPRKQQSTERPPTPNSGRGEDTEPEATMHSHTTTIRTLTSIEGPQAQGVRRTKRDLY